MARRRGDYVGEIAKDSPWTPWAQTLKSRHDPEVRKAKSTQLELLDLFIAIGLYSALSPKNYLQFPVI